MSELSRAQRRRRDREAVGLWDENLRLQAAAAARGKSVGKAFNEPTVRAAFIRLYRLTRWEDLSLSLAPLLALSEHDSATLIDREAERFIDANMAALDPEDVGPGAWEILERKGWREVARIIQRRKAGATE